jgi:DNA-binding transcriptional regulator YiaG
VYTARVEERERYAAGGSTGGGSGWTPERVTALRRRLGLTQAEFARRLGVRQQTVSEWETGLHRPRGASTTLLRMLAEEAGRWEEGALPLRPSPSEGGGSPAAPVPPPRGRREQGAGSGERGTGRREEGAPPGPGPAPREEGAGSAELGAGSGGRAMREGHDGQG